MANTNTASNASENPGEKKELARTIGLSGVLVISLSAMLPGIFVTPTFAAEIMGPGIWLAFLLSASVVLPAAMAKSELASGMPSSGGTYVYLERTYGPLVGTVSGLGLWASFLLKAAFALIGFSAYLLAVTTYFDVEFDMITLSLSALVLITVVNIMGVSKVKVVQAPILYATLTSLVVMVVATLFSPDFDPSVPLDGAFDTSVWKLAETAGFVFVAYAGVTKVAAIGGEVMEPEKNLPRCILLSLVIATVLYTLLAFMMMAVMPDGWYLKDGKPIEDPIFAFATHIMGTRLGVMAAILSVLTMISMALAGVLASSRFLFAMSRDKLLPQPLEDVNTRFETPHIPILLTGIAMGLAILYVPLKDVVKLASGFKIMIFMMVNSCVIVLRQTSEAHDWNPAYKGKMYPYLYIWGIVAGAFMIVLLGEKAFIGGGVAFVAGVFTYMIYGRKHYQVHSATPFNTLRKSFSQSTGSERERMHATFKAADHGHKNHLTLKEFQNALAALGYTCTTDESRAIFHEADENEDGVIDIDEFLAMTVDVAGIEGSEANTGE